MQAEQMGELALENLKQLEKHFRDVHEGGADPQQCPRANVMAVIMDELGTFLGIGQNRRPGILGPCDCDDKAPTMEKGSQTCLAIHAEVEAVLSAASAQFFNDMSIIITTRPPCRMCLSILLNTPIQTIITTDKWSDRDNSQLSWEKAGHTWITIRE